VNKAVRDCAVNCALMGAIFYLYARAWRVQLVQVVQCFFFEHRNGECKCCPARAYKAKLYTELYISGLCDPKHEFWARSRDPPNGLLRSTYWCWR
jgi:hypothetical protein